jgi:hypothetical protein
VRGGREPGHVRAKDRIRSRAAGDEPDVVREILDAVLLASDQISVYYESGHVFGGREISRRQFRTGPFPNWTWEDFTGYDIRREKPFDGSASEQLQNRRRGKTFVVVVQLHLSQTAYEQIEATDGGINAYRVMLLETVLNASRSAVTGLGAGLHVIGGLT